MVLQTEKLSQTAPAHVRTQVSSREMSTSGTWADFLHILRSPLSILIPPPCSQFIYYLNIDATRFSEK
jgi:hypothetical protein